MTGYCYLINAFVVVVLALVPQNIVAQAAPDVGTRIRIYGAGNEETIGRYIAASSDSLVYSPLNISSTRTVELDAIKSLLQTGMRLDELRRNRIVRFRTVDGREVNGLYAGRDSVSARLSGESAEEIPIARIREIQEQRPVMGRFAVNGLIIGSIVGSLAMAIAMGEDDGSGCAGPSECSPGLAPIAMGAGAAAGGATGLLVGTLIGSARSRWQTIR
jgi:hypothetical protein